LESIRATRGLVSSNTNLGIVLLLAPLAKACSRAHSFDDIRANLNRILQRLTVEDARLAYEAIRIAKPGGMGKAPDADISEPPSITLLQAMQLAQDRDSVAREYAAGYPITFEIGLPALRTALERGAEFSHAVVHCFLTILGRVPDTLIARKTNAETAQSISLQAERVIGLGGVFTPDGKAAAAALDQALRDPGHRLNPGTTADLTTAAIFLVLPEAGGGMSV
jgi:triphosphoribosyl-dephospho-CoA synthase